MSVALASALWGGDYLQTRAAGQCAGVNLHGGSRSVLKAALGNTMPGERVAKAGRDAEGGFYAPVTWTRVRSKSKRADSCCRNHVPQCFSTTFEFRQMLT